MANISHNEIIFNKSVSADSFKRIISETTITNEEGERYFDFNKLVPQPKDVFNENSVSVFDVFNAIKYIRKFDNNRYQRIVASLRKYGRYTRSLGLIQQAGTPFDEMVDNATETKFVKGSTVDKMIDSILATGYADWYEWSSENWNTKWNAMNTVIDYDTKMISFDTAWDVPTPVLDTLFVKYQQPFNVHYVNDYDGLQRQINYRPATVK